MLGQTFFTQCPKLIAKTIFLKERFSLDTLWVNLKSTSGNSAGKIITHAELFLTRRPRVPDKFKKNRVFFLKKYLWTCRMQYQQTCRIVFAIIPGSFAQCPSMKLEGVRFEKNTNCSYRNLDCSFDIPAAKKILARCRWFFSHCHETFKKFSFFRKEKISLNDFFGHVDCSFDNLAEKNSPRAESFFASCPRMTEKKRIFFSNFLFPENFLWTLRMQFWQHCRKVFARKPG